MHKFGVIFFLSHWYNCMLFKETNPADSITTLPTEEARLCHGLSIYFPPHSNRQETENGLKSSSATERWIYRQSGP